MPDSPLSIGPYRLASRVLAAPMAGVTDRPYRRLCRRLGASYAVGEMAASNPRLWDSEKTMRRIDHAGEPAPVAVQLAGSDPAMLAEAARFNAGRGAQIIDLNMGCPAKKVLKTACGSALLRDEILVARIIAAVVAALAPYGVPVTLKTRTGWDPAHRDGGCALRIARLAEDQGIAALVLHGRTRACGFGGEAEYETLAEVKAATRIPVIANGDIDTPQKARQVLARTGADGVMIGRAAQGRPWLFHQVAVFLETGEVPAPPDLDELRPLLLEHLDDHYGFYGEHAGVRTARKHIQAYFQALGLESSAWETISRIDNSRDQARALDRLLQEKAECTAGPG